MGDSRSLTGGNRSTRSLGRQWRFCRSRRDQAGGGAWSSQINCRGLYTSLQPLKFSRFKVSTINNLPKNPGRDRIQRDGTIRLKSENETRSDTCVTNSSRKVTDGHTDHPMVCQRSLNFLTGLGCPDPDESNVTLKPSQISAHSPSLPPA